MAATTETTTLDVTSRSDRGSRSARRLRRTGRVPGVIYGGGEEPVAFDVDARMLRNFLAHSGAVIDVCLDGESSQPVLLKNAQRHPVRGEIIHADFLRIDLKKPIQTTVTVELIGGEEAPGVVEGGVLSVAAHELHIEALPNDIPDSIVVDVSGMQMNDTLTAESVTVPSGVTLLDDLETTVATITPPTLEPVEEEIETETEVVGEGEEGAEGEVADEQAEGATGDETEASAGGDSSE